MNNVSPADSAILSLKRRLPQVGYLPSFLSRAIRTTSNWPDILMVRLGLKESARAVFRDGGVVEGITPRDFRKYADAQRRRLAGLKTNPDGSVSFPHLGRTITLHGITAPISAFHIFFRGEYSRANAAGKSVVDIGANIGDTALYFLANGASRVLSFEPYPYAFRTARKNLEINGASGSAILVNAAVGGRPGHILLDPDAESYGRSAAASSKSGERVRMVTLKEIVDSYPVRDALLKLDCEGAEYEILLESDAGTLRTFSEIILEYHYGYSDISTHLEGCGFRVERISPPLEIENPNGDGPPMVMGLLLARRM